MIVCRYDLKFILQDISFTCLTPCMDDKMAEFYGLPFLVWGGLFNQMPSPSIYSRLALILLGLSADLS